MKKIAIYDRYLSTAGGGERYSCKMADILSRVPGYSVHLITDLFADTNQISQKLNLDLSKIELRVFPYISDDYTRRLTAEYDLFINATYLSSLSAYARHNIYLCYFPTRFDVDFRPVHRFLLIFFRLPAVWLFRLAGRLTGGFSEIDVEEGIYEPKRFMLRRGSWAAGRVSMVVRGGRGFRLGIKNPSSSLLDEMKIRVEAYILDERKSRPGRPDFNYETVLKKGSREIVDAGLDGKDKMYRIVVSSDTFRPSPEENRQGDTRILGAALYNEASTGIFKRAVLRLLGYIPLFLVTFPRDHRFLDSYDRIITISGYSSRWIKRLWKKESTILFPPVDTAVFAPPGDHKKEKVILSVGRFFPEHHNKKQFELASTFINMLRDFPRDMEGYTLYLAGGMEEKPSHREYVEKIKELARGYPVRIMVNIPFKELKGLFRKASIFWHAAGLGEDEEAHPEKFEHFGITTVEAMSAGCIPVVIDRGGQKEIVKDGIDGFLFRDLDCLVKRTLEIIRGSVDRDTLRKKAVASSHRFSNERFSRDLLSIIGDVWGDAQEHQS